ncbi:MAG: DEAD/DEAH box helicase [Bradymonadales bacterium]|nr:DEAD/DEAH box helicase [Bradymonadales bacterium]
MHRVLQRFEAPVREWFCSRFAELSPPQAEGWPSIADGKNTLILAPTGSGKTLAAFLWSINTLVRDLPRGEVEPGVHTLYISPLVALSYDIEKNLGEPLVGIRKMAQRSGYPLHDIRMAVRTGDTPSSQRAAMLRRPPHILVTTPESFFLILSSPKARDILRPVRTVIIDEIHALCGNKRGVHLAVSLERLVHLGGKEFVRIGLSATQRPVEEVARFLGGCRASDGQQDAVPSYRAVHLVDTGLRKSLDIQVASPVPDFAVLPDHSVWPEIYLQLIDLIRSHRSTLIFVQMRAQAERISNDLNELAGEPLARAHHGSISRAMRRDLESRLKAGELRALVATGTLELGIDVGAIDLVVQIQSPGSVTRGLQRVGRAGHLLDAQSQGRLIPTYREDLVELAVVCRRMLDGQVEALRIPRNALDVLAQQVAAAASLETWNADDLLALIRRAYPYNHLSPDLFRSVLDLLAGRDRVPTATRTRTWITWDHATGRIRGLSGSLSGILRHAGTIPDQGQYGLYLVDGETRLGQLDEEFVFETQVSDIIQFGNSTWLVEEIERDRVLVRPAPGQPGKSPFWKGGLFGRDFELSEAIGAFRRQMAGQLDRPEVKSWLQRQVPLDDRAAESLIGYFEAQKTSGGAIPTDQCLVVEHFLDELGDHRVAILSTFGSRVNAPLAMAVRRILRARWGLEPQVMYDDNAILLRAPASETPLPLDILAQITSRGVDELVLAELTEIPMFGTLFRHNAGRFLVLSSRGGGRTPLWLLRLRSADLLEAVRNRPDYPVTLETYRECLQDVLDLPALRQVLERIESGRIQLVVREVDTPSPMAAGAMYRFMTAFMYQYDEPRAERRLRALSLDRELLAQLLSQGSLPDLLEPAVIGKLEETWQGRAGSTRARDADELFQLLVTVGDLPYSVDNPGSVEARCHDDCRPLVNRLISDGRACLVRVRGQDRLVPTESLDRLRIAFQPDEMELLEDRQPARHQALDGDLFPEGALADHLLRPAAGSLSLPSQPVATTSPASPGPEDARPDARSSREEQEERVLRAMSRLGPSIPSDLIELVGLPAAAISEILDRLAEGGELVRGLFVSTKPSPQYCTRPNLDLIHRRSLAFLRSQVEPCSLAVFQRFLLRHQHLHLDRRLSGEEGLLLLVDQLAGRLLPAEIVEREILSTRFQDYRPEWLSRLVSSGQILWSGFPWATGRKKRIALYFAEDKRFYLQDLASLATEQQDTRYDLTPDPAADTVPFDSTATDISVNTAASRWDRREGDEHTLQLIRSTLDRLGASFVLDLLEQTDLDPSRLMPGLWELVWRGEVGNDSFETLRTAIATGFRAPESPFNPLTGRPSQFRTGPHAPIRRRMHPVRRKPLSMGRWFLLLPPSPHAEPGLSPNPESGRRDPPSGCRWATAGGWRSLGGEGIARPEARITPSARYAGTSPGLRLGGGSPPRGAWAFTEPELDTTERLIWQLLARYGVLSKDLAILEQLPVSWGVLYRTLERLEMLGQVRRGYFIEGLAGAQFALPETIDELRELRDSQQSDPPLLVNACDPALLPPLSQAQSQRWPFDSGVSRIPTSYVVIDSGEITLWAEASGRALHFHPSCDRSYRRRALTALAALTDRPPIFKPFRRLEVETIDGRPAGQSPFRPELEAFGFQLEDRLLVYRPRG